MAVDQVGDAVEITDAGGRYTYVNRAFERLTGFASGEVIGRRPREVLSSGQQRPAFYDVIERHAGRRRHLAGPDRQPPQGRRADLARTRPSRRCATRTGASPTTSPSSATSPSRRRPRRRFAPARRATARSSTRRREFIARITPDGRLQLRQRSLLPLLRRPTETCCRPHQRLFTGTRRSRPTSRGRRADARCTDTDDRIAPVLPDGSPRWEQWVEPPALFDDGRADRDPGGRPDITEQRDELALKEGPAIGRWWSADRILEPAPRRTADLRQRSLLPLRRHVARAAAAGRLERLHPDRAGGPPTTRASAAADTGPADAAIEIRAFLPDGSERWELWVDTGIFDRDGTIVEIQSVGRDVTERKQAELALGKRGALSGTGRDADRIRPAPAADGALTFVNEAYCRYRGLDREVLLAGFNDIYHYPPTSRRASTRRGRG